MDGLGSLVTAGGKAFLIALFFFFFSYSNRKQGHEDRVKSLKKKEERK